MFNYLTEESVKRFVKLLPLLTGVIAGLIWAIIYAFFEKLHDMQKMFAENNLWLIGRLITKSPESLPLFYQTILTALDVMIIGFIFGLLLRFIIRKLFDVN